MTPKTSAAREVHVVASMSESPRAGRIAGLSRAMPRVGDGGEGELYSRAGGCECCSRWSLPRPMGGWLRKRDQAIEAGVARRHGNYRGRASRSPTAWSRRCQRARGRGGPCKVCIAEQCGRRALEVVGGDASDLMRTACRVSGREAR